MVRGDSGGGLVLPDGNKRWHLRGVVSVGDESVKQVNHAFFTNVTGFLPWMADVVREPFVSVVWKRCRLSQRE